MKILLLAAILLVLAACTESVDPEDLTSLAEGTIPPEIAATAAEQARLHLVIQQALSGKLAEINDTAEAQSTASASDAKAAEATRYSLAQDAAATLSAEIDLLAEERMNPIVVEIPAPTPVPLPTATPSLPDFSTVPLLPVDVRQVVLCLVIDGQDPELPALIEVSGIGLVTHGNAETTYDCIAVLEEYAASQVELQ